MIRIAIDAMGGDHGPSVTVPAVCEAMQQHPDVCFILVGREEVLRQHLQDQESTCPINPEQLIIQHASQEVEMGESPAKALRGKKDSALRVAINLVKSGQADACISAGNTGALVATAHFVLKTLPGIDRPAIVAGMPNQTGSQTYLLDLGANIDCTAKQLYQFAVMGATWMEAVAGRVRPRVGLLNVGVEDIKGTSVVKEAAELIGANSELNYVGFVEGDGIFSGVADLIVCDGFVGNVTLKTCEGLARYIGSMTQEAFQQDWQGRLASIFAYPILKRLGKQLDIRRRNGAVLLGLQGIVVKSHGSADSTAFAAAIDEAILEASKNVPILIQQKISELL